MRYNRSAKKPISFPSEDLIIFHIDKGIPDRKREKEGERETNYTCNYM